MDHEGNQPQGQRMLAAIIFTDVVGFSTLAGVDESRALRLLERDSAIIKSIADRHGASVVKGTGDGTLICFASAVEAVQAALEIQEALRAQNESLGTGEALKHRLGVHLGDVVVLANDVIGDGVNVAARLQSEAKPGGIAISDAVYSVVRGKVSFKATNLGPRNLKHIVETVNVWMIPPHDEPTVVPKPIHPDSRPGFVLEPQKEDSPKGLRLAAILIAIVVCVGLLAYVVNVANTANRNAKPLVQSTKPSSEPTSVEQGEASNPARTQENSAVSSTSGDGTSSGTSNANESGSAGTSSEPPVDDEIAKLAADYEFDTAADQLERRADAGSQADRLKRLRRLGEFRRWLEGGIGSATETNPILVRGGGSPADKDYEIWTSQNQMSVRLQDGSVQNVSLRKLEPRELLRITAALFRKEGASPSERLNIVQRARDFAIEMRLGKLPDGLE